MNDRRKMVADEWFLRADQFWIAAEWLARQEDVASERLIFPNITCRAFASEAYLKCLLTLRGKHFAPDHDLRYLFKLLPLDDKDAIEQSWNEGSLPAVLARAPDHPSGVETPRTLSQALKRSALAFKDFRYRSPSGRGHWFLGNQPLDVRNHVLALVPEWKTKPPTLASTGIATSQYQRKRPGVASAPDQSAETQ
jgi:hypothetical protein